MFTEDKNVNRYLRQKYGLLKAVNRTCVH